MFELDPFMLQYVSLRYISEDKYRNGIYHNDSIRYQGKGHLSFPVGSDVDSVLLSCPVSSAFVVLLAEAWRARLRWSVVAMVRGLSELSEA
jgi:hypothetical protein